MYEELVKRIRGCSYSDPNGCEECRDCPNAENYYECKQKLALKAADAIEDLNRQRDRAYARLCEWCGVCPEGKRNAEDCEIAALNPEPPKEIANG